MNKIKTLFFGSGKFAVPILNRIMELEYIDLKAVITQPDKPVGRKQVMTPTPLGMEAEKLSGDLSKFEILKPEKIKVVSMEILEKFEPELVIVASYGQIIPSNIIKYPKYKCINFHGSILPKLRGAVPVQMAILQGLEETGVTMQIMEEGMDVGDVLAVKKCKIMAEDTSKILMDRLAGFSAEMLEYELPRWLNDEIVPVKQDESSATYCYKSDLSKEKAEIVSSTSVQEADRMVRAFYPQPVAWVKIKTRNQELKTLKIYKARLKSDYSDISEFPKIIRKDKNLYLRLIDGYLELLDIQLEGKNRGKSEDYLYLAS